MRFGRNRQRGESVLGRPALTLDFRLRGYSGRVAVAYEENRDPHSVGFDALGLPFDLALTVGYPTCRATVEYAGPGYRAYMGWIQLVTNHDPATGTETVSNDVLPIHRDIDSPFVTFGVAPTFFDAPANPDHDSEDWIADTFLVACPDVARTRCVAALAGVPVVALFGPSEPALWSPVGERLTLVRSATGVMSGIGVEEALGAVVSLLSSY
jgi:hypothetical protein